MVAVTPLALVPSPTFTRLNFGLFSVVNFRSGDRWEQGVQWENVGGTAPLDGGISMAQVNPLDMVGLPKTLDGYPVPTSPEALPFTVYGDFVHTPVAWSPETAQDRARANLLKWEQNRTEQALWTGDLLNAPNLKGANGSPTPDVQTVLGATATTLRSIAILEEYIGKTFGQEGVIHMTRAIAAVAIAEKAAEVKGNRLVTRLGTPIVAGAGYPGTAPQGNVSTATTWMYATPPLFGYQSEIFDSSNRSGDLLDRGSNDLHAIAERTYLLAFDTSAVGAVEVTTP